MPARGRACARRLWSGLRNAAAWPLYRFYERRLLRQISKHSLPKHVGIVLDGNRRYAVQVGLANPSEVYRVGAQKLDDVLMWCAELGIAAVTLWVCSTENLERPADQVFGILKAVEDKLRALCADPHIHHRRVRVQAIGRLSLLPASTRAAIHAAEDATMNYDFMLLSIAIAYGGREEITDAVRAMLAHALEGGTSLAELARTVTPEDIGRYLYLSTAPEPDLIIRTSGEVRLSGFLLWQSARSEFYFSDVLWPAFRKVDFLRAMRSFQGRKRRFGL